MNFLTVFIIAIGLAMDAFAVSIASGISLKKCCISNAARIALSFGLFQALMPILGWIAGQTLRSSISHVDHWIAFGLLAFIGGKMIYESRQIDSCKRTDPLQPGTLLLLSIATSIDALAVGFSLAILNVHLFLPVLVIGIVTFVLSFIGVYLGDRIGHICEKQVELIGGLVLIGIGVKILIEHLAV